MKTRLWKKRFRLFVWYKFWKHNLKPGLCFLFMHRSGAEKDGSAGAISSIILSAPLTIRLVLPAVASSLCSEISSRGAAHLRARPVQFVSEPRALSEQKFSCGSTYPLRTSPHDFFVSITVRSRLVLPAPSLQKSARKITLCIYFRRIVSCVNIRKFRQER